MKWPRRSIKDIAELRYGQSLPEKLRIQGSIPVYGSGEQNSFHNKSLVDKGIIIGRKGTVGSVRFSKVPFFPIDTVFYVNNVSENNDLKFFYYFLKTIGLENFDSDAAVPGLNRNLVHKLVACVPELAIQQKIASILSAYDDLIEVNNQRIKLLEETATELYKEWFVRMRFTGYKKAKFKKGIPVDWKITVVGEIIDYHIGGGWGNDAPDNEFNIAAYVIRGTDIPKIKKGQVNREVYRYHKSSNIASRELIEGDIVFETAGGSEGQPLGRTCFITNETISAYGDKIMAASFCKQIRPTKNTSLYFYHFLNYLYDSRMIETFQIQSTGISNYQFEPFLKYQQILLPPESLLKSFHEKAILIQKQIATLGIQNTQLRQIRDRLLPRLVSGKLQLKEDKNLKEIIA